MKTILILFGGVSAEHDVSLMSAQNIIQSIDYALYQVIPVYIQRNGVWLCTEKVIYEKSINISENIAQNSFSETIAFVPGSGKVQINNDTYQVGCVFPVLHGRGGEDGSIQGFCKTLQLPVVGPGILASAVCMDKDITKKILRDSGLPVVPWVTLYKHMYDKNSVIDVVKHLGLPLFIKPANEGSSVGVTKVKKYEQLHDAIQSAFEYDAKVLCEQFVDARECECSVLGSGLNTTISAVGEIVPGSEWYDYATKYGNDNGTTINIPAELPETVSRKITELARNTYDVLGCRGMSRIDFFVQKDTDEVYINEVNTIPGFTQYSMYPKLLEHGGMSQQEIVQRLIGDSC
jgi:D-alanine-D-alanine ligase